MFGLLRAAVPVVSSAVCGAGLVAAILVVVGCGRASPDALHVFAASSLTEGFQDIERQFEAANPGTDVVLSLAGSQVLRVQIERGAKAHVFASANADHMRALVEGGHARNPEVFAGNQIALIVPLTNPAGIGSFAELPRASRLVIGSDGVPVGEYAREVLRRAGPEFEAAVLSRVVSYEHNARLVRSKVALGEADAGLVYRTDAMGSAVRLVPIPEEFNVSAKYSVAAVNGAGQDGLVREFSSFLLSDEGRLILARHGFEVGR
jgi:molybdate transport system substrate-binding protein